MVLICTLLLVQICTGSDDSVQYTGVEEAGQNNKETMKCIGKTNTVTE